MMCSINLILTKRQHIIVIIYTKLNCQEAKSVKKRSDDSEC